MFIYLNSLSVMQVKIYYYYSHTNFLRQLLMSQCGFDPRSWRSFFNQRRIAYVSSAKLLIQRHAL